MLTQTEPMTRSQQLLLAGFESLGVGVEDLPAGLGGLGRRELVFVNRLLEHGQMARAALEAGYAGEKEGAGVWASKTLRKAKVFRVYKAALAKVSADADQLVQRVYERSALWHAKAKAAAQEVEKLDGLLLSARVEHDGCKDQKVVESYETQRTRMMREERHYAQLAVREDTLLGSLLGKLRLDISGSVEHTHQHYVHGTEFTQKYAEARRRWEAQAHGGRN